MENLPSTQLSTDIKDRANLARTPTEWACLARAFLEKLKIFDLPYFSNLQSKSCMLSFSIIVVLFEDFFLTYFFLINLTRHRRSLEALVRREMFSIFLEGKWRYANFFNLEQIPELLTHGKLQGNMS